MYKYKLKHKTQFGKNANPNDKGLRDSGFQWKRERIERKRESQGFEIRDEFMWL